MMDSARAASVLNLDAKSQAKSGHAGTKGEAGDRKIRFQDTLNKQTPAKSQQLAAHENTKQEKHETVVHSVSAPKPDVRAEEAPPAPPAAPAKPAILLSAAARLAKPAADPEKSTEGAEPRIDIASIPKETKARSKDEVRASPVQSDVPALDENDPGELLPAPADKLSLLLAPGNERHAKPDTDQDDKRLEADVPVKDVLDLLQEKAQVAMPVTHVQQDFAVSQTSDDALQHAPQPGEGGTTYRLSRADGKGGVLDLPAPADPAQQPELPDQTINQVVVVDQRRYLAPAQDNALAVINTLGSNQEWAAAMQPDSSLANAAAMAGGGKVVNTLKIQMHPIDLGLVTATMRLAGEELTVELKVDNSTAYRQLKDDQNRIVEALKAQGFNVDQVSVVMSADSADRGNAQSNNAQNGQGASFTQQNQTRDGAQGQAAGRGHGGHQQERSGNGKVVADEGRGEVGGAGNAGTLQPGHIYL